MEGREGLKHKLVDHVCLITCRVQLLSSLVFVPSNLDNLTDYNETKVKTPEKGRVNRDVTYFS